MILSTVLQRSMHIVALCATICLSLAACSNSSSPSDTPTGTVSATVDGASFTASVATSAVHTGGVLAIAGSDSRGRQIQLRIIGAEATGTYPLGGLTNPNVATVTLAPEASQTYVTSMVDGTGSINLTELTASKVAGTFSFTASNSARIQKTVTNGTFNLTISK